MLKADLLALIADLPDDADIRFDQPTHDYWRTHLAIDITAIDEVKVKPTAYHNDEDAIQVDDEWNEELKTVYIIR